MYLEGYNKRDIIDFWRQNNVHRMTKTNRKNKNKQKTPSTTAFLLSTQS